MKKLFVKKTELIAGELFVKKTDVETFAKDLIYINAMLGNDDMENLMELLEMTIRNNTGSNGMTIRVPVTTTKKVWKLLKEKSGKNLKLVATTEHKVVKPNTVEMGIVLV